MGSGDVVTTRAASPAADLFTDLSVEWLKSAAAAPALQGQALPPRVETWRLKPRLPQRFSAVAAARLARRTPRFDFLVISLRFSRSSANRSS